jgi:hypothetical protein
MKIQQYKEGFVIRTGDARWLSVHMTDKIFEDNQCGFNVVKHTYNETQDRSTARWFPTVEHAKNVLRFINREQPVSCYPTTFKIEKHVGEVRLIVTFGYNTSEKRNVCKLKGIWAVVDDNGEVDANYYLAPIADQLSEACRIRNTKLKEF